MAHFEYRNSPNDRFLVVGPENVYESDFSNPNWKLRLVLNLHEAHEYRNARGWNGKPPHTIPISTWKSFQEHKQIYFGENEVANYAAATDEAPKKDAVNPAHYKRLFEIQDKHNTVTDVIQWLEHLQYKPFWRNNMHAFVHAVRDMCADKYLSRMGMKDDETQEMEKALWYFKFATAVMKNGYKPVRVDEIERILAGNKAPSFYLLTRNGDLLMEAQGAPQAFDTREAAYNGIANVPEDQRLVIEGRVL